MPTPESKACTKCGVEKALGEYHRNKAQAGGRHSICADCARATRNAWYRENRETNLAYQKLWRAANADKKHAGDAAWRKANVERKRANDKAWREANHDAYKQYLRDYRQANKDKPAFREAEAAKKARRRARMAGVEHQPYTRREIYDRDGGACKLCKKELPFEPGGFHLDHIVPIVLGGADTPANLQLTCQPCNQTKHAYLEGQTYFAV